MCDTIGAMSDGPFSAGFLLNRIGSEELSQILLPYPGVDELSLLHQLSLHLPRFDPDFLQENENVVIEEADRLARVLNERRSEYSSHLESTLPDLEDLEFVKLENDVAKPILEDFHYIRSFRQSSLHFGLRRKGANCWPVAMVSLSPFDLKNIRFCDVNATREIHTKTMVLSRVFAFPSAPRNALSFMFAKLRCWIKKENMDVNYLVTYVNPNLGFTGASYRADNWQLLGEEDGTVYHYVDDNYATDRALWNLHGYLPGITSDEELHEKRILVTQSKADLAPLALYIRGVRTKDVQDYGTKRFPRWLAAKPDVSAGDMEARAA